MEDFLYDHNVVKLVKKFNCFQDMNFFDVLDIFWKGKHVGLIELYFLLRNDTTIKNILIFKSVQSGYTELCKILLSLAKKNNYIIDYKVWPIYYF